MLERGILHIRVATHFGFHKDTVLNLWKHYHVPFTACKCLRSYHQRVKSKKYGVYTRVTHLCNCFQIACAISWSIPGLCAINAKTGHSHLRGVHHLPLPVCRPTSHGAGELPSSTVKSADFRSQQICNNLVEISCRCGLSSCTTFTEVPLHPWGLYGQQWLIRKEDTFATDVVTSLLTSES